MTATAALPTGGYQKSQQMKSGLGVSRSHLVELMQDINFGRIENLRVRGGQPAFDGMVRVVREVKFGGENGPRLEFQCSNFTLKAPVVEMFQYFDRIGNCHIDVLEIKHGLPFRMLVREEVA